MRAVIQRVSRAKVTIDGAVHGEIGKGFLILLGVCESDTEAEAVYLADKCVGLRVFTARPELAVLLYEKFLARCRESGLPVETGVFGADMAVELVNDGPVTILMDTEEMRGEKA